MSSETGQNLLLSHIRRLQEDLYSNEENDYQFIIPTEHEETWLKIENAIEHYDQIMSANRNEAMKNLAKIANHIIYEEPDVNYKEAIGSAYHEEYDMLRNYILKTSNHDDIKKELEELKEIISLHNNFNNGTGLNEKEWERYKKLSIKYNSYLYGVCKGSEE